MAPPRATQSASLSTSEEEREDLRHFRGFTDVLPARLFACAVHEEVVVANPGRLVLGAGRPRT